MLAHNMPRPGGEAMKPMVSVCNGNHFSQLMGSAEQEIFFLKRYLEEGIRYDCWWQDAGWYPCDGVGWVKTGTWEPDRRRFPKGLREVSDFCHANGIRSMVWFEPERVHMNTWLAENHPEWIHGGAKGGLLDLGNPECRKWATDHFDKLLTDEGIDIYRQDYNIDPIEFWRAADAEDRQGITEIRHVEGYLAYWDELLRRHPKMFIDTCASGGRRNDVETLRRAVPMLRSDYTFEPVGEQCHTYGVSFWMPFHGTGFIEISKYLGRSCMAPEFTLGCDMRRKDLDYDTLRQLVKECRRMAPFFFGDYYPLTSYSLKNDVWMAWQYDRPDLGEGAVQVFRRADSPYETARLRLRGLRPDATYEVQDIEPHEQPVRVAGKALMDDGLPVTLKAKPDSAIFLYRRAGRIEQAD
jgi:alpha-galactosidase